MLFRQFTRDENETLATTWGPFGALSRDGRWLVLGYWIDTQVERRLARWTSTRFRATGAVERRPVSVGDDGQASGTVIDGTLYLQTTKGAPKGRVVAAAVRRRQQSRTGATSSPERADAVIEGVAFARGRHRRHLSAERVERRRGVRPVAARPAAWSRQPGIGSVERRGRGGSHRGLPHLHELQLSDDDLPRRPRSARGARRNCGSSPTVPVDPSAVEVEQVWYPSKDGTQISMFLVHRKGLTRTARAPTLLYGYGGFNISETPAFAPTLFQWFEAGGLFAMPNLRGGGEYGDAWHEAGMLDRKQNVFDDFIAAAEWLIAQRLHDAATGWRLPAARTAGC